MDPADLRAYVNRDWAAIARMKQEGWLESKKKRGALHDLELGARLYRYVRGLRPDWPDAEIREEDLARHIRVSAQLGAVQVE